MGNHLYSLMFRPVGRIERIFWRQLKVFKVHRLERCADLLAYLSLCIL